MNERRSTGADATLDIYTGLITGRDIDIGKGTKYMRWDKEHSLEKGKLSLSRLVNSNTDALCMYFALCKEACPAFMLCIK